MAIHTQVFPKGVSSHSGWSGGPKFRTDVVVVESGREQRNPTWAQARREYEASQAAKLPEQYEPLQQFFEVIGGMELTFPVKDFFDYQCPTSRGVLINIAGNAWQLYKRSWSGAAFRDRLIMLPGAATVIGGAGTLDIWTGIWTGTGTPTSWSSPEFYVPCRFGVDEMNGVIVDQTQAGKPIIQWGSIPIIEVKSW